MHSHANSSASQQRMEALRHKHALLEQMVRDDMNHPSVSDQEIKAKKLQKLRIKQEIEELKEAS